MEGWESHLQSHLRQHLQPPLLDSLVPAASMSSLPDAVPATGGVKQMLGTGLGIGFQQGELSPANGLGCDTLGWGGDGQAPIASSPQQQAVVMLTLSTPPSKALSPDLPPWLVILGGLNQKG